MKRDRKRQHANAVVDRGEEHVHRYTAACVCGWLGVHRRRRADADKLWRAHANSRTGKRRAWTTKRPLTPQDRLPEALRRTAS